jgi:RHS repeat-associated protein
MDYFFKSKFKSAILAFIFATCYISVFSQAVGIFQGDFEVNSTGAATYSVPIEIPKMSYGQNIGLAIVYNSQSGDGIMGLRWSVAGLSTITRARKTFFRDGVTQGISLDDTTLFNLDGNRLVPVGNNEYSTVDESFIKVRKKYVGNNYTFDVLTKNGDTIKYEPYTVNNKILNWRIKQQVDVYGNSLNYQYNIEGNIEKIKNDKYEVVFSYETRPDPLFGFIDGTEYKSLKRLKSVHVKCGSTSLNALLFTYDTDKTLLRNIERHASSNTMPILEFNWDYTTNRIITSKDDAEYQQKKYYHADFNGDGLPDYVLLTKNNNLLNWNLFIGNINGTFDRKPVIDAIDAQKFLDLHPIDINNDGKAEIYRQEVHNKDAYNGIKTIKFLCYKYNGNNLQRYSTKDIVLDNRPISDTLLFYGNNDFNGDGLNDYLIMRKTNYAVVKTNCTKWLNSPPSYNNPDTVFGFFDYNGDGTTDVLLKKGTDVVVYKNGDTPFPTNIVAKNKQKFLYGDFNGDGLVDILELIDGNNTKTWYIGNGRDYINKGTFILNFSSKLSYVVDLNGDGISDLINFSEGSTFMRKLFVSVNDEHQIVFPKPDNFEMGFILPNNTGELYISDFNGDGSADFHFCFQNGPWKLVTEPSSQRQVTDVSQKVNSTTILQQKICYKNLSNAKNNYIPETGSVFPILPFSGRLPIVTQVKKYNYNSDTLINNYYYKGARIHLQGLGFLGFKGFYIKNCLTGDSTETTVLIDTVNYFKPVWVRQSLFRNQQRVKESIKDYISRSTQAGTLASHLQGGWTENYLTGLRTVFFQEFDEYGNLTYSETDNGETTERITNVPVIENNCWIPNRILNSTVVKSRNIPFSTDTKVITYTYNAKGSVQTKTERGVTTTYEYSTKGEITSEIVAGNDVAFPLRTSYLYAMGVLLQVTEPNGNITRYQSYNILGLPGRVVLPNGNIINYTYDSFGRIKTVSKAPFPMTSDSLTWAMDEHNALYKSIEYQPGIGKMETWFDMKSRPLRVEKTGFDGTVVITNSYDNFGRLYTTTYPYYSGETARTITYQYDEFDRIWNIDDNGKNWSYSYDRNVVTVSGPETTIIKTMDASGNITNISRNGQSIQYELNANNQVVNTSLSWGGNVAIGYNPNTGYRDSQNDPSAGISTYNHNVFGQLLTHINAKNETLEYKYDRYSRDSVRTFVNHKTEYKYIASGNNKGLLGEIKVNSAHKTGFSYDTYSRIIKDSLVTDRKMVFKNQYSEYKLVRKTYPNNVEVVYEYNTNGYLVRIKSSTGTVLWETLSLLPTGEVKEANLGPIFLQKKFSTNQYLQSIDYLVSNNSIQRFGYQFNEENGNLVFRSDSIRGLRESFGYDQYERLKEIKNLGTGNSSFYNYSANGNIASSPVIGSYGYQHSRNLYAVTSIKGDIGRWVKNQTVTYTAFGQPATIINGDRKVVFDYGHDLNRRKMQVYVNNQLIETWYYYKEYEVKITNTNQVTHYSYINGPDGPFAMYVQLNNEPAKIYYILKDHLGSITGIADSNGILVEEFCYDAWGNPRDINNWKLISRNNTSLTNRGFTFHEHLLGLGGLINMNGRVYDAEIHRFISPDNNITDPTNPQNYNRYSYCLNNPLKYTDPTGHDWRMGARMAYNATIESSKPYVKDFEYAAYVTLSVINIPFSYGNNALYPPNTIGIGDPVYIGGRPITPSGIYSPLADMQETNEFVDAAGTEYKVSEHGFTPILPPGFYEVEFLALQKTNRNTIDVFYGFLTIEIHNAQQNKHKWYYDVPGIGSALESGDCLVKGDYIAATAAFGFALFDVFTLGSATGLRSGYTFAKGVSQGTNVVYQGFNKAGVVEYVGITGRDAAVRFGEHLSSGTAKSLLRYEVVPGATNLSRTGARVWEQTLINQHGLNNLLNVRNSIAPKYWFQYGIKP